ncbi:MAG: O-antigen ligase family protein [Tepidanaerobacteraceae bacterium]|jgi:O-antigen ligase
MEKVNRWVQSSLFLRIISFFLRPDIYKGSLIFSSICVLGSLFSKALKDSILGKLFSNNAWESKAIRESRFLTFVSGITPFINRFIDFLNACIKNSYPFKLVTSLEKSIIKSPFVTLAYILLPAAFISTALQAIFESFTKVNLGFRIIFMTILFIMAFINVPLKSVLFSSHAWRLSKWLFDERVGYVSEEQSFSTDILLERKLDFIFIGILGGTLYYFLPATTFIKLFGLIFISIAIYKWLWLGLVLIALMLPLMATSYSVAIIGLTFFAVLLNHKEINLLPVSIVPVLLFMVAAGLAALFSVLRAESLVNLPLYAAYFMVFYIASVLLENKRIVRLMVIALIISALLLSLYGIYQYFIGIPTAQAWVDVKQFPELATRVYATLENPNVLAEYLGLAIPLALGLFFSPGKIRQKTVLALVLSIMTLCIVLTFSRGAWLGLAISFIVFALIKEPKLLVILVVIAVLAPIFLPPVVTNRIASIGSLEDSSNAYRITIWIAALRMIRDYWLNGVGLGLTAFSRVYRDYMIAGASAVHAHNLYLQICLEMGILGLIALLWLAVKGFSNALTAVVDKDRISFVLSGVVAALAGHFFHGLFDYVWYSPRIVLAFWMYFGMMSALVTNSGDSNITGEKCDG